MEQEWQNDAGALTAQAIPQKDVEQACFHALGLVGRNCEYLEQHLARVGADEQTRQAVNDISAAAARLDRTMNEVMTLLDFLRAEEPPQLSPLDLCQMLQQIAAQADMVQEQLDVELTLDYGGLTSCRVMADCSDAELLCRRQSAADAAPVRELLEADRAGRRLRSAGNEQGSMAGKPPLLSGRGWAWPAALPRVLPPYGLGPAGRTACTGKRHPGRRDHPAVR